jgi:hypothetical protein
VQPKSSSLARNLSWPGLLNIHADFCFNKHIDQKEDPAQTTSCKRSRDLALSCSCQLNEMSDDQSQHVVQIPQAVSIAASVDPNTPTELRQQAVEYLQKVKELSDQTWKVS